MAGSTTVGVILEVQGAAPFFATMKDADASVFSFAKSTGDAGNTVSSAGQVMIGALRQVGTIAVEAAAAGAKAIGAFAADAVTQAGDFQQGLLNFSSIVGDSISEAGGSVESFSALFLKLGADTQFSAAQAEDAAINLAKGGLTPAQIAGGALADTLTLASAGELDLATAADITAKQLGVWADTGTTSAQVADLLAQSANASVVSVEGLALGMANVGGVAKLAGASFQDTVTALGAVSAGFSSAADAGTSMKAFLMKLQPTTKPAIKAMTELGLYTKAGGSAFYDAQGSFVGFSKAADLLQGSLKGMTKAQQEATLQVLFGTDGIRVAAILAQKGAKGFDEFAASMAKTGTAAEQAEKKNQGYKFALDQLSGSMDTLKVTIGMAILPMLTAFVNLLTPAVNAVTDFSASFMKLAPSILTSTDPMNTFFNILRITLPQAIPLINGVQYAFDFVATAIAPAITAVQRFVSVFSLLSQLGIDPVSAFFGALQIQFPAAIPIINAVHTAFDVLAAGIQTIVANAPAIFATFSTVVSGAFTIIVATLNTALSVIETVASAVLALAAPFIASFVSIAPAVQMGIGTIPQIVAGVVGAIQTAGAAIIALITPWIAAFQSIAPAVQTAIGSISSIVSSVITTIQGTSAAQLASIQASFMTAWTAIATTTGQVWNGILGIINPILAAIAAFVAANGADIRTTFVQVWTQVNGIIRSAMQLIQATVVPALQAIGAFVARHGSEIEATFTSVWVIIKTVITATLSTIQGVLTAALAVMQGNWSGAWTAIVGIANTQASAVLTVFKELGKLIVTNIALAMDMSISKLGSAVSQFTKAGSDLIAGVISGVKSMAGALVGAIGSLISDAVTAAEDALRTGSPSREAAEKIGTPFVLGIVAGIEESTAQLQAAARKLSRNLVKDMEGVAAEAAKAFKEMFKTNLESDISIGKQKSQNLDMIAGLAPDKTEIERTQKELTGVAADISKAQGDVYIAGINKNYAAQSTAQNKLNTLLQQQAALQKQLNGQQQQAAIAVTLQAQAQAELAAAEARATELHKTNAAAADKQFALESKQIAERYQLQQELAAAQADHDTAAISRLQQQISLLATTQQQEKQLLDITNTEQNPLTATLDKLKEIQASLVKEVERDQFMADVQKNPNQRRERQKEADTSKALLTNISSLIAGVSGGTITPPAGSAQAAQANVNTATTNQYYYSPTYGAAPRNPSLDFAVMQSLNP